MKERYLSKRDVLDILKSDVVQQVINKITPKQNKVFQFFRGVGFILAIIGGLAGYYISWLSAQDSHKVEEAQTAINRDIEWLRVIDQSVMEMRKTVHLIKLDCQYGKYLTQYEQDKRRFLARYRVALAMSGVSHIFNMKVFEALRNLTAFDESISDVCAKDAPPDEAWEEKFGLVNNAIGEIIKEEKLKLLELSKKNNPFFQS